MAAGPFTVFNLAKPKVFAGSGAEGIIILPSHTFKMALCTSSQSLTAAFLGTSTNAQYSDLTGELTTAAGYTAGGVTLASVTFNLSAGVLTWTSTSANWTLTGGGVTFKYGVIYDFTASNKDLWCFFDASPGGGSVSPAAGSFSVVNSGSGIVSIS